MQGTVVYFIKTFDLSMWIPFTDNEYKTKVNSHLITLSFFKTLILYFQKNILIYIVYVLTIYISIFYYDFESAH